MKLFEMNYKRLCTITFVDTTNHYIIVTLCNFQTKNVTTIKRKKRQTTIT